VGERATCGLDVWGCPQAAAINTTARNVERPTIDLMHFGIMSEIPYAMGLGLDEISANASELAHHTTVFDHPDYWDRVGSTPESQLFHYVGLC
jgi:hypothetical protein